MIYHHAISRAVAQAHIEDLIAEAIAERRTSRWRLRRIRRPRLAPVEAQQATTPTVEPTAAAPVAVTSVPR